MYMEIIQNMTTSSFHTLSENSSHCTINSSNINFALFDFQVAITVHGPLNVQEINLIRHRNTQEHPTLLQQCPRPTSVSAKGIYMQYIHVHVTTVLWFYVYFNLKSSTFGASNLQNQAFFFFFFGSEITKERKTY